MLTSWQWQQEQAQFVASTAVLLFSATLTKMLGLPESAQRDILDPIVEDYRTAALRFGISAVLA